jgi:Flp pilus assembly protein TadD
MAVVVSNDESFGREVDAMIQTRPDVDPAYAARGLLALRAGDLATAESHFRRACEREPESCCARALLAHVLDRTGRNDEAEIWRRESVAWNWACPCGGFRTSARA